VSLVAIQTMPEYSIQLLGTKIYWPWYTLIGASLTLITASVLRKLGTPRG
jgi:hypothetical protein